MGAILGVGTDLPNEDPLQVVSNNSNDFDVAEIRRYQLCPGAGLSAE
jgi:hypothetical protein